MSIYPDSLPRKRLIRKSQTIKIHYQINQYKQNNIYTICPLCNNKMSIKSRVCKDCWKKELTKNKELKLVCPNCGEYKGRKSKLCFKCVHKKDKLNKRKFNISKEELDKLINVDKLTLIEIGKMFGVSDSAIKKRAKRLGIYYGRQKNYKNS
jgi:hypothetical protein